MNNNNVLTEEEYIKIKRNAKEDRSIYESKLASALINIDKNDYMDNIIATNEYYNNNSKPDARSVYVATFLIPDDDKFESVYIEKGKNVSEVAGQFDVKFGIAASKVLELDKYRQYRDKINAPQPIMDIVEIRQKYEQVQEELIMEREKNSNLVNQVQSLLMEIEYLKSQMAIINNNLLQTKSAIDETLIDSIKK